MINRGDWMRMLVMLLVFEMMVAGCKIEPDEKEKVSYPYVYSEIEYFGMANLPTSYPWPTDTEVFDALQKVIQSYVAAHPSTGDDILELDGVIYEMDESSITPITGGVPQVVFDNFWKDLKSYSAGLWSCWGYVYYSISSKGATSQAYVIYAICDDKYTTSQGHISYFAARATIRKKNR